MQLNKDGGMLNKPLTLDTIRTQVEEYLSQYHKDMTLESFIKMPIESIDDIYLRDIKLITKGVL